MGSESPKLDPLVGREEDVRQGEFTMGNLADSLQDPAGNSPAREPERETASPSAAWERDPSPSLGWRPQEELPTGCCEREESWPSELPSLQDLPEKFGQLKVSVKQASFSFPESCQDHSRGGAGEPFYTPASGIPGSPSTRPRPTWSSQGPDPKPAYQPGLGSYPQWRQEAREIPQVPPLLPGLGATPPWQVPPGWGFFPGVGWAQSQWSPGYPQVPWQPGFAAWMGPAQSGPVPPPAAGPVQGGLPGHSGGPGGGQVGGPLRQGVAPPPAPVPVPTPRPQEAAPRFRATFDGNPKKFSYFLHRVWAYADEYGDRFQSDRQLIDKITEGMDEGEAAEWVAGLHDEAAPELDDTGAFIHLMRQRFRDEAQEVEAEEQIQKLRQAGRPVKELVWEFRRAAGKVRDWPEKLLVHTFREALDSKLREACEIRGVPCRIQDWYATAIDLDRVVRSRRESPADRPPRKQLGRKTPPRPVATSRVESAKGVKCYRCGQAGHRATECLAPAPVPQPKARAPPGVRRVGPRPPEPGKVALQQERPPTPPDDGENWSVEGEDARWDEGGSDEDDPMVSEPVRPFLVKTKIKVPETGTEGEVDAIIDTGCSRCLISQAVVDKLQINTRALNSPIRFQQLDGSLIGGVPATLLTEPVELRMGRHRESLKFIVAPKMSGGIILGLAWLDKWAHTIKWEEGHRKLKIHLGPEAPLRPEEGGKGQNPGGEPKPQLVAPASEVNPPGSQRVPREYRDLERVFSEEECNELPPHRTTDCAIEFEPGVTLPKPKMYSMSPKELGELRNYIDTNLERGFIQPAKSKVAAPVLFKEKKDGGVRLCVDFRGLNAVCVQNTYPIPIMKDLLNHLAKGKVFTKLDLREAYYRIRIREGDEWKTAFNCPLGSFQFKVMPFGLQGAPAVFMQYINEVLHPHLYKGVLVYLDDILIFSETLEEHIKLVRQVLKKLLDAKLYVKLSKCEFHQNALDYLGYRISKDGIEMDPGKVRAVLDWQPPRTRKQLQSFLGFANFYRQFIPAFAEVALPLTELLKTGPTITKPKPNQPIGWTMDCQKAFERLKRLFAQEPILLHPDPERQFIIQSDASDVAVAAVLLQKNEKDQLLPCAYLSKKLTVTERRWAIWEKEAFAVRCALLTWRQFLEGAKIPFEVWTDHKNLEALKSPRKLSPKQVRWAQYFRRFKFELKHIPAGKNLLADALSRKPQYDSQREQEFHSVIPNSPEDAAEVSLPKGELAAPVLTRQQTQRSRRRDQEEWTGKLKAALPNDPWLNDNKDILTMREGVAWKGSKLYVPASLRLLVLQRCHDAKLGGHFGYLKTLHLTRRQFWWPKLKSEVEDYVKSCATCATSKHRPGKPPGLLQQVADPSKPWEEIAMDFIVELPDSKGNTVIWTIVDLFSKQAHFVACSGLPSARHLAKLFLKHIYRLHGVPKRIISDRGVQFTAKFWREFLSAIGSTQGLSSAFHPSTNGAAERANAMVEQYLRCYVDYQQRDWAELLPFAEVAYNNAVHSSTGMTPFQVTSGQDFVPMPELPTEAPTSVSLTEWMETLKKGWEDTKKALNKAAEIYKKQADKHRLQQPTFRVGDRVFLSTKYIRLRLPSKKLGPKFIGPFPIIKIINPVTVQLALPRMLGKIHPVFHCSLLKPVTKSEIRPQTLPPPPPLVIQGETHYEVKKILDSRIFRGQLQYLIHWQGYPLSESTWVKSWKIKADRLIDRFHQKYPDKPKGPPGGGRGG